MENAGFVLSKGLDEEHETEAFLDEVMDSNL